MEIKFMDVGFLYGKRLLMMLMKTLVFLSCFMVFSFTPKNALSQKIEIEDDRWVTVDEVFDLVMDQTEYTFVYQVDLFKNFPKVHLKKGAMKVEKLLGESLPSNNFNYRVTENKTIVVWRKDGNNADQQLQVSGSITDEQGIPVTGAHVFIQGTMKGTEADFDGNYSLLVPSTESILVVGSLGYKTQEIVVGDRNKIDVVLIRDVSELDEVVISTGYQKIEPEQSTGSVSTLTPREYDSRINTTNFLQGIQNKIPGLLINNDVQFEGNNLFQIRGISTINGNSSPLIVVDGFPTDLSLDMINPNDIESVTVLKDAAAAAIYGVRSSNGVIIIERKKAKAGKLRVDFRQATSITPKENYGRYRWDKDGANTNIDYYRGLYEGATSADEWGWLTDINNGSWYNYQAPRIIVAQQAAGVITPEQAEQQFSELGSYNNAKEYGELFQRTAITNLYNLDISGGNENVLYYLNANFIDTKSNFIENGNKSFQLSGRGTFNFSDRFSLDLTNFFQQSISESSPFPDINNIYPYERFHDQAGNPLPLHNGSNANPYYNQALMDRGLLDNMYYPLADVYAINDDSKTLNNRITANFNYRLSNELNLRFGGVYETSRTDVDYYAKENSTVARQMINRYTTNGPNESLVYNVPMGGFLRQQALKTQGYTLRAQLDWNKKIKEDHALTAILGSEIRTIVNESNTASYFGYNDQTLTHQGVDVRSLFANFSISPNYAFSNPTIFYNELFNQQYAEDRYVSAYANAAYTYKGRYSVTGSIRIDQSNLFGTDPKYRYKPLWSVGLAWNINKERFMEGADWVNVLKLRSAYGFNGNVAKNSLPQIIAGNSNFNFGMTNFIPSLYLVSPANRGLRWEQTHNINVGLDYDLFKNVRGSIDYYVKKSTDLLATTRVDPTRGVATALINQASVRNNGIEFKLNADWITNQRFNWNTGLVFSHNDSKVLSVYNIDNGTSRQYIDANGYSNYLEGYEVGAVFNYQYAGVDENGAPLIYDSEGNIKPILEDQEKGDVKYVGSSIPKISLGLSNRVDIGDFYAYAMVNYFGGFKSRVPVPTPLATRPIEGASDYWKQPGDEADPTILPAVGYRSGYDVYLGATDMYTVNGAYLTLADLTCAYSLRNQGIDKMGLSDLELRFQASNIYTVGFNDYNFSPATGSFEKSYLTPTYTLAVTVSF
ncbi:SusC/RagA family TonB-linked outer membrane protein [Galbibacter sp. EGI 63066]|uniref:SusC/RagA family TonB-linked outer membrane protein n=1 Tax=Galbibacter sp. EGI 63066 TaxID=2993559 RepID=UPI002248FCD5|nr:SusC/RagA family TonB-linked outer membrane protein [Galbibacter sp. EGI 63066]MCX2681971.1 SusC/RagA family TonB-linked outer membrane protein [Galbibacter sp. EGI 63066]